MKIGYARVSTKHQCGSLDEQIKVLKRDGSDEVYSDVCSGAGRRRCELTIALKKLKKGDTLVVTAIDRLGRSVKDLINIISDLKERGIGFCSLKEQMDTNTDIGMLLFNMICSIAEFERKLINRRIYEGVQRAKVAGKYRGKQHCVEKKIRREFVDKMNGGKYTIAYLAKMARVSRGTLYNWKHEFEVEQGG